MVRIVSLLILAVSLAVSAAADTPSPSISLRFGLGMTPVWEEQLSDTLTKLSQSGIDKKQLAATTWALGLNFGGLETDISATRTTNTLFGPPSGTSRTRLIVDAAELTFGSRWPLATGLYLTGGLGVGVSSLLLQTYNSGSSDLGEALGATGQVSLMSRWNWSPVASARLSWRFYSMPGSPYGYSLGIGLTATGFFLPMRWKIADDTEISGIGAPWGPSIRPTLWLGFE